MTTQISDMRINFSTAKFIGWVAGICVLLLFSKAVSAQTYTIGSGTTLGATNTTAGTQLTPFKTYWHDGRTQYLYRASEITGAGASSSGGYLTGIAFNIQTSNAATMSNFNVYVKNTSTATLGNTFETGATNVYSGSYVAGTTGWKSIVFTTPFCWDGTSNLLIQICFDNGAYTANSLVYNHTAAFVANTYSFVDNGTGCSLTTNNNGSNTTRPNIKLTIIPRPTVPTVSNNSPICLGNTVNLTASGLIPGSNVAAFTGAQTETSSAILSLSNTFTVDFWVNPGSTRNVTIQQNGTTDISGTSGQRYAIYPSWQGTNGGLGVSVGTNGIGVFEHGANYLPSLLVHDSPISGWTHVAVIYNAKTPSLYVNGVFVKSGLTSQKANVYPSIGTGGSGGYGPFIGSLDNVRIWNAALTESEVQSVMYYQNATVTGKTVVAKYTYNGSTITDQVGSNANWTTPNTYPLSTYFTYTWAGSGTLPGASTSETQTATPPLGYGPYGYTVTAGFLSCTGPASSSTSVSINATAGLSANDYLWAGNTSNLWTTASNWYSYNGSLFSVAGSAPALTNNVYIPATGTCVANSPNTAASSVTAKDVTIASGAALTLGAGSTLTLNGSFYNNSGNIANVSSNSSSTLAIKGGQQIGGNTATTFGNLTVSNAGYVSVNQTTTVTNTLTMNTDIFLNSRLILGTSAVSTGTLSTTTPYIMAGPSYFQRWFAASTNSGNTGLLPVGEDSPYARRHATLEYTVAPTSGGWIEARFVSSQLTFYSGLPLLDAGVMIQTYMNEGYWEINPGGGLSGGTYNLQLYYDLITTINTPADLRILKSPAPAHNIWVADGTHGTVSGTTSNGYVTRTGMSGFSWFVVSSNNGNPLPVELLSLDAEYKNEGAIVTWTTATEQNCSYYDVEKSIDGINYEFVTRKPGTGNSSALLYYSVVDNNPYMGISYYRLKQVDTDGNYTYYGPVALRVDEENQLPVLYPNPAQSGSLVSLSDSKIVSVHDITGKKILQLSPPNKQLTLPELERGIYFITDDKGRIYRFVVE